MLSSVRSTPFPTPRPAPLPPLLRPLAQGRRRRLLVLELQPVPREARQVDDAGDPLAEGHRPLPAGQVPRRRPGQRAVAGRRARGPRAREAGAPADRRRRAPGLLGRPLPVQQAVVAGVPDPLLPLPLPVLLDAPDAEHLPARVAVVALVPERELVVALVAHLRAVRRRGEVEVECVSARNPRAGGGGGRPRRPRSHPRIPPGLRGPGPRRRRGRRRPCRSRGAGPGTAPDSPVGTVGSQVGRGTPPR